MGRALDDLIDLLELEQLEANLFRGVSPDEDRQRVFGGQVAGQALIAAGRTVDSDRFVHSLHAYFLRPGDPRIPIVYDVDRIHDGHSFTTRRVVAIQHGRAIFNLSASFHVVEPGPEHQYPMPAAPDPESLPTMRERLEPYADRFPPEFVEWIARDRPIDTRSARLPRWLDPDPSPRAPEQLVWFRADGKLPDDPLLHACVVAYASDLTLLDTAVMSHANSWDDDRFMIASLDHAMWFHRPLRADEWLLYDQKSPSAQAARGLAEGFIFRIDGALAVTVIQEGLMRPIKPGWQVSVSPIDHRVDLRSDTVTTPTPEMRRAMADAEVGDDVYGEDPTVNRLQSLAASLLGKEAALYVPSGTMANQLAIRVLAEAGTEVLCPERAHVYRYEAAAAPVNSSVQLHPLWDVPDGVRVAIEGVAHHLPRPSLVVIENSYMALSGTPIDTPEMATLCDIARSGGLAVHVDGARIWNAAIVLGTAPRDLVAPVDTVMFCLSKGLGAPVGSLLCGPAAVIAEARAFRSRWGGGMRQAGVIVAAGVVALETMVERLADDHVRARTLADALAQRWPGSADPAAIRTNIVCADLRKLPVDFVARLEGAGVRTGTIDARTFRLVTHKDVDDDDIAFTIGAFDELVATPIAERA